MSKDWNRASFEANTRPIHVDRDITAADLVAPSSGSLLVLTLGCLACGLGLAFLFVFWPLMLVAFLDVGVGQWIVPAVLVAGLVFAAWLLIWELRVRRDVADELLGN